MMTIKEVIDKLNRYSSTDIVTIQDSNGFIYDIDFICADHLDDIETDTVLLAVGQLQGGSLEGTFVD